jgi:hypothetical protein
MALRRQTFLTKARRARQLFRFWIAFHDFDLLLSPPRAGRGPERSFPPEFLFATALSGNFRWLKTLPVRT